MTSATAFKEEAHKLVDQLPETASWRDLVYRAAVRDDIEAGIADSKAGHVTSIEDVLKEFDL